MIRLLVFGRELTNDGETLGKHFKGGTQETPPLIQVQVSPVSSTSAAAAHANKPRVQDTLVDMVRMWDVMMWDVMIWNDICV